MKVWIKLIKYYQGGSNTDYKYVDKEDIDSEDKEQDLMENWGESTGGGHAYGYRVDMHRLKRKELPPQEWLEKAIKRNADDIEWKKKVIVRKEQEIIEFQEILNKLNNGKERSK